MTALYVWVLLVTHMPEVKYSLPFGEHGTRLVGVYRTASGCESARKNDVIPDPGHYLFCQMAMVRD